MNVTRHRHFRRDAIPSGTPGLKHPHPNVHYCRESLWLNKKRRGIKPRLYTSRPICFGIRSIISWRVYYLSNSSDETLTAIDRDFLITNFGSSSGIGIERDCLITNSDSSLGGCVSLIIGGMTGKGPIGFGGTTALGMTGRGPIGFGGTTALGMTGRGPIGFGGTTALGMTGRGPIGFGGTTALGMTNGFFNLSVTLDFPVTSPFIPLRRWEGGRHTKWYAS